MKNKIQKIKKTARSAAIGAIALIGSLIPRSDAFVCDSDLRFETEMAQSPAYSGGFIEMRYKSMPLQRFSYFHDEIIDGKVCQNMGYKVQLPVPFEEIKLNKKYSGSDASRQIFPIMGLDFNSISEHAVDGKYTNFQTYKGIIGAGLYYDIFYNMLDSDGEGRTDKLSLLAKAIGYADSKCDVSKYEVGKAAFGEDKNIETYTKRLEGYELYLEATYGLFGKECSGEVDNEHRIGISPFISYSEERFDNKNHSSTKYGLELKIYDLAIKLERSSEGNDKITAGLCVGGDWK